MYVSAERLISEIENLNVDERQYTQVDISADAEHGTKLDNSGDHDGSEQATFTPVKSKNAKNMEKGLDFNESLLPAQCLLDHQYGMQECGQIWWDNGAEEASIDGQALCRAYTIRQSLACEIDYCKERLAAWKRSLFTWGFVLLIIGGGLVGAGIPLGLVFVVVGAFAFGLSTAPLLDVIDFLNCR
ncbi:MAG: hypothetical protein DHS20C04_20420 [Hyphococcus sp.]|nr:MAG: hypothetical protein DHS20C04_20420 [Marinicaulis sp.]